MVYNAMKLFMEINPQLFDECSHEYTEMQNTAEQRQRARQSKWDRIAEQAKRAQAASAANTLTAPRSGVTSAKSSTVNTPMRVDEVDPVTQDNQQRLNDLRIQDEGISREYRSGSGSGSEWRLREQHDRQALGSSGSRSQR